MSRAFFARLFLARQRCGLKAIPLPSNDPRVERRPGDSPAHDSLAELSLVLSRARLTDEMLCCAEARFEMSGSVGQESSQATCDDFARWVGARHKSWPRMTGGAVKVLLKSADHRVGQGLLGIRQIR